MDKRYTGNNPETLEREHDPRSQLVKSLTAIVTSWPPQKPWEGGRKSNPKGVMTGPTSIAYLFLWLSKSHPDLVVSDRTPAEWCLAYLDCGQDEIRSDDNVLGIRDDFISFNAVKAAVTKDPKFVERCRAQAAAASLHSKPDLNDVLVGRCGTLALLRIVRYWVPEAAPAVNAAMKPIIEHVMASTPWNLFGKSYIGAAHGDVGIITQLVLCDPCVAPTLAPALVSLLEMQQENGHWGSQRTGTSDLVQFCHGAPGFVISLMKLRPYFPTLQAKIDAAIEMGRQNTWQCGRLIKEPCLCHGVTGNAMALDWPQREHMMTYATAEAIAEGLRTGTYTKGLDPYGLYFGEAGRAWGWMIMEDKQDRGYPAYTDV